MCSEMSCNVAPYFGLNPIIITHRLSQNNVLLFSKIHVPIKMRKTYDIGIIKTKFFYVVTPLY